jgi:hypothetical protein
METGAQGAMDHPQGPQTHQGIRHFPYLHVCQAPTTYSTKDGLLGLPGTAVTTAPVLAAF